MNFKNKLIFPTIIFLLVFLAILFLLVKQVSFVSTLSKICMVINKNQYDIGELVLVKNDESVFRQTFVIANNENEFSIDEMGNALINNTIVTSPVILDALNGLELPTSVNAVTIGVSDKGYGLIPEKRTSNPFEFIAGILVESDDVLGKVIYCH